MQEESAEIKGALTVIIGELRAERARHSYITNYLVAALAALGRTSCRFGSGSSPCSTLCRF